MADSTAPKKKVRHVLGISGGKDSSALAIYMRDRVPEMEYFFCDTGAELPETYEYLNRLEAALGKPIARLNADRDFDHWLEVYQGTLPSPQMRWCTKNLKIKPLEEWIGDDEPIMLRRHPRRREPARLRLAPSRTSPPCSPSGRTASTKDGVMRILDEAGIGLPDYYEWRTRSGCYFCFFQRKHEWVGLADRHPELFEQGRRVRGQGPLRGDRHAGTAIHLVPGRDPARADRATRTRSKRSIRMRSTVPPSE